MVALSLATLVGLMLGIRFNVKMLILAAGALVVGHVLFGLVIGRPGSAVASGLAGALALQVGYFAALLVQALGLARTVPEPAGAPAPAVDAAIAPATRVS
ncbi:hypothetical protein [Prosthecomicrobium sp. N25]|uniref:hypothetical protein n=1 Tax=Prosthecomicrobium sp. N25 TaxID=3129254 RepID=UPI0030777A21